MIPDFLTRYYPKGEYPFVTLNELPFEDANRIKKIHCERNGIGFFYAEEDYLIHRREIEKWIYSQLVEKGGHPNCSVPIYMILGESPKGEFDIRVDTKVQCIWRVFALYRSTGMGSEIVKGNMGKH